MHLERSKPVGWSAILVAAISTLAVGQDRIVVDAGKVVSDVSRGPVGLCMNFLLDRNSDAYAKAVKAMGVRTLRYPMGTLANHYLFNAADPNRPLASVRDRAIWACTHTEPDGKAFRNALGFDDYVALCKRTGAEPVVMVGVGSLVYNGDGWSADWPTLRDSVVAWVRHANKVRRFGVKYWEIGNENDLKRKGPQRTWAAAEYAEVAVKLSRAMKAVDPSIKVGVNGMTTKQWWDGVLAVASSDVDFVVTHQYSSMASYEQWRRNDWRYMHNIETAVAAIRRHKPSLELLVTEISSFNPGKQHWNNVWKALHNFEMLGNVLQHREVRGYHFWITRFFGSSHLDPHALRLRDGGLEPTPMGRAIGVWGRFLRAKMVASSKVGSHLRSWATYDPEARELTVFLLNKDTKARDVEIETRGYPGKTTNRVWALSGLKPGDAAMTWRRRESATVREGRLNLVAPPLSVTVLCLGKAGRPSKPGRKPEE